MHRHMRYIYGYANDEVQKIRTTRAVFRQEYLKAKQAQNKM